MCAKRCSHQKAIPYVLRYTAVWLACSFKLFSPFLDRCPHMQQLWCSWWSPAGVRRLRCAKRARPPRSVIMKFRPTLLLVHGVQYSLHHPGPPRSVESGMSIECNYAGIRGHRRRRHFELCVEPRVSKHQTLTHTKRFIYSPCRCDACIVMSRANGRSS